MENNDPTTQEAIKKIDVKKWHSRCETAIKFHLKELMPKYNTAKKRYHSEIGYANIKKKIKTAKHSDVNLLYKDVRDFVGSIFYRNPRIDLTADNEQERESIENLEQKVNDDIRDDDDLKSLVRSCLIDENLAGMGALYIDYSYIAHDTDELIEGTEDQYVQEYEKNHVEVCKIMPENVIRPPWIKQYNWKKSPYLGYADIVPLETLKQDQSLDQKAVGTLKGAQYKDLLDRDIQEEKGEQDNSNDDIKHVKCFYVFIKEASGDMYRLVLASEQGGVQLSYDQWDKGHKNFPIHLLMLNDSAEGLLPPSEAWILETLLQVIDYVFEKLNKHLKKSSTKTYVKQGKGGVSKEEINKIADNINREVVGIDGLPNTDIRTLIMQVVDSPLAGDHDAMLSLALRMFDDISRQPAFSKPSTINKKITATEANAIQRDESTENGDYVDKLYDFFKGLFLDWVYLTQNNFMGVIDNLKVEQKDGIEDTRELITRDKMQGKFKGDIVVESFMPPNKELKRRIVKDALADLPLIDPILKQQGLQLNGKKIIEQWADNIEMRDSEDLVTEVPIRLIDQQITDFVFKGVIMNPEELGADKQKAIQRGMEIFQDDQIMSAYRLINPEIEESLAGFLTFLAQEETGGQPKQSSPTNSTEAQTDVGMQSAELGAEQRI